MTIALLLVVALVIGARRPSRWTLLAPLALASLVSIALALTGHGLSDTPIPFLVVVGTLVMVGGQGLRSQGSPPLPRTSR